MITFHLYLTSSSPAHDIIQVERIVRLNGFLCTKIYPPKFAEAIENFDFLIKASMGISCMFLFLMTTCAPTMHFSADFIILLILTIHVIYMFVIYYDCAGPPRRYEHVFATRLLLRSYAGNGNGYDR
jgi:hypothetical protein